MSRIIVFDLENRPVDEFNAVFSRGWCISDADGAALMLDRKAYRKKSLDFGRMIYASHPTLPSWAGMIDTPWGATAPVQMNAYDVPYLLRVKPYGTDVISGDLRKIAARLLNLAGQLVDHQIQLGDIAETEALEDYPIETTAIWDQIKNLATATNCEIQFRSSIDPQDRRLVHFLDIVSRLGVETDLVLRDGSKGNSVFGDAKIDGDFRNSIKGMSDASTGGGKKFSNILNDDESIRRWRMRNDVVQLAVSSQSDLNRATRALLDLNGRPVMTFTAQVLVDRVDATALRLGNVISVRATRMYLPAGVRGWAGPVRITAMSFDEANNSVTMALKGALDL